MNSRQYFFGGAGCCCDRCHPQEAQKRASEQRKKACATVIVKVQLHYDQSTSRKATLPKFNMDVSKNKGIPKWMVKIMDNPIKIDDLGVFPLFLEGHPHGT